ncbi:hypothetical protein MSAN_00773500 [Mycena sanguinolenta]|uniref:Uncharacterized protein n=1 Tax=Mycena sanguinolenta TaxID=230812 RepID=A0A8H6Z6R8_9AGAR|nr:hypothetical protein MSAN_00773500 [Mycena sanguinolenta]
MAANLSLVPANLADLALESCLRNASSKRRGSSIYWSPIFLGAVMLFVTITAHWILAVDRAFLAFIHPPVDVLAFYGDLAQTTVVVKTAFIVATLIIGDTLIIHRLWIVWGYNKYVILFPVGTLIGVTVSGVGITYQLTVFQPGESIFLSEAGRWITGEAVFTLCTNVYSTAFIFWQLWNHGRHTETIQRYGGPSLKSVLVILIESAALYTMWTILYLACYRSESNLQYIVVDCWPAVTGISCMLIHVRVGLGWAQMEDERPSTLPGTELASVAVNITRVRHTDMSFECPMDESNEEENKGVV